MIKYRKERTGAAVVEMAVVLPVFLVVVLAIIEFGHAMTVEQLLANAARLGARRAILANKTNTEVEQLVRNACQNIHPTANFAVTVSVNGVDDANLAVAQQGDLCAVTVGVPFNEVSLIPTPRWLGGRALQGTCTMEHE